MRKVNEKKINELQGMTDEYLTKKKINNVRVKLLAGVAVSASAIMLLAGCGTEDNAKNEYAGVIQTDNTYAHASLVSEMEKKLEKEIAQYLSLKTGVGIELVDVNDVDVVRSSGNYLVISGEMITNVKEGNKKCTITLELSDEQMKKMEECLSRHVVYYSSRGGYTYNLPDDIAAAKYDENFLTEMKAVIDNPDTKISAIYDKDNKEWIFDEEEPVQTTKR